MPAIVRGRDCVISAYKVDGYYPWACVQEFEVFSETEQIASTSVGDGTFRKYKRGLTSWGVRLTGVLVLRDLVATRWFGLDMFKEAIRTSGMDMKLTYTDTDSQIQTFIGDVNVSQSGISAIVGIAKFNVDFQGNGAYSIDGVVQGGGTPGSGLPQLATPVITIGTITSTSIGTSWAAITNATGYTLLRGTVNSIGFATQVYQGAGLSFANTGLPSSQIHYFWLQADGNPVTHQDSDYGTANATTDEGSVVSVLLPTPTLILTVNGEDQITASWAAIANATGYRLYRGLTPSFGSTTLIYNGPLLTHISTLLAPVTTYYYWLTAVGNGTTYLDSIEDYDNATTTGTTSGTFNTSLTFNSQATDMEQGVHGFSGVADINTEFHFNFISPRTGAGVRLVLSVATVFGMQIDFPNDYSGQPYKYIDTSLVEHFGNFPNVNETHDY